MVSYPQQPLPSMPRPPQEFTAKDWETHREKISALYKKTTLTEIRVLMRDEHGIEASEKQYKDRLNKWSVNNKNIKKGDWNVIIGMTNHRNKIGKPSRVRVHKHLVTQAKVNRYLKDHPKMTITDSMIPGKNIPSHIAIYSPHKTESDTPQCMATPITDSDQQATPRPQENAFAAFHNPGTPSTALVLAKPTPRLTTPNVESQENDIVMTDSTCEGQSQPTSVKDISSIVNTSAYPDAPSPYAAELSSFAQTLSSTGKFEGRSPDIFASELRGDGLTMARTSTRRRYRQDDEDDFEGEFSTAKMIRGDQHPDTIKAAMKFAQVLVDQGRYRAAEEIIQTVWCTDSDEGDQNIDKLYVQGHLAEILEKQGFYQDSMKMYRQTIHSQERLLGSEHKATLTSKHRLAWNLYELGQYKEAEQLEKEVIEIKTRIYGADHHRTLASISSQGRDEEAVELMKKCVDLRTEVLGAENLKTIDCMYDLACWWKDQGRHDDAIDLMTKCVELYTIVHGAEHTDTIISMHYLAKWWKDQGRHDDAIDLMTKVVELYTKVLGTEHTDTITSMQYLATWWKDQGRHNDAGDRRHDDEYDDLYFHGDDEMTGVEGENDA
ncbi:hypothetical protein IFR05_002950 [Cadophora sp. M221]|nr:hypothetical protein IFR05_002950 [Cadophora sp. M221]